VYSTKKKKEKEKDVLRIRARTRKVETGEQTRVRIEDLSKVIHTNSVISRR